MSLNFNTATETQKPSSLSHRWQYNSKEKLTDLGINWNDYGARMYMSDIGKMSTIDRFAEKYEILTPYHYGANNPIKYIDVNGDSLVVMSAPEGAKGAGHAAILVGNETTGWKLFSKNGTNQSSGSKGENDKGDNIGTPFKSLKEFANSPKSPQNTVKTESGKPEYQEGYLIPTDSKTDVQMTSGAMDVLNKDYSLLGSSCIDVCSAALKSGGKDPGYEETVIPSSNPYTPSTTIKGLNDVPNIRYDVIKQNNKGSNVTNQILPKRK